ncbi:MAG TPA: sugar phosphate isomerase/epimerase family protein [Bryobacteraceae bacterium]|nr:sugar phosphate isomerase/epimerase family protein [Bryobacteraceae bacterium]
MNRRHMLTTLAAVPAASLLRGQSAPPAAPVSHLKPGLVAYSYRTALAAKKMTYEDIIHMASDWGLSGVDTTVYWLDTSPHALANLRRTAFKAGIQLYNAGARIQLAQPTKEKQDAQVEEIKKWVDVADAIGASHVRVFGGPIPKGATEEQAIGWAIEVLKRGSEYSGDKGIILGVEDDGGLSATAPPTIAIAKGADSPWAGINADSGNLPKNGYTEFPTLLPYATSIHFKTMVSDENGKKIPADWPRLLSLIAKSGYRGFVGLEYESNNAEADVPGLCAKLRELTAKATA